MLATRNRRYFGAFLAALAGAGAAVGLAACGHSVTVTQRRLGVALSEYRVRPDHIVASPGPLTVTLENVGRLTHNLVISRDTATTTVRTVVSATATRTETGTTTVAARSGDIAPGATSTLTVGLTPGRYRIDSTVDSDQALGAEGTLTVTSK